MIKKYRISKRELCPCGSGKRFKVCCYARKDKKYHPNQIQTLPSKLLKRSIYKTCLHPNNNECSTNIIGAHALQNNRILSKLSVDGHVVMMNFLKKPFYVDTEYEKLQLNLFDKVGVNKATKYPCFCKKHDDEVFADIEKDGSDFALGNVKQEFLFAYKAFIFEYYINQVNNKQVDLMIKDIPSKLRDPMFVNKYRKLNRAKKSLEVYKLKFDEALVNENYEKIQTNVIEIDDELDFANFCCITPKYNLDGGRLRLYNTADKVDRKISITIFPSDKKSYVLISYFKDEYKFFKKLVDALSSFDHSIIKFYLNCIVPIYSDNIVLSPKLWNNWTEDTKIAFNYYNNLNGQEEVMLKGISFGLKNNRRRNQKTIDYSGGKINLFK